MQVRMLNKKEQVLLASLNLMKFLWLARSMHFSSTKKGTLQDRPVQKARSRWSMSEVSRYAPKASVRAMMTVGTSATSAAKRAAVSFWINSEVGTSTCKSG